MIIIYKNYEFNNKAFTFYETIFSMLIIALILNFSYIKYNDFKEKQSVSEAVLKINDTFFYASSSSLKEHQSKIVRFHTLEKKITIMNEFLVIEKEIKLPKNLIYHYTINSPSPILDMTFTKNGNISQSFSIYIFNKKEKVRYRVSFFGFDKSKFLRINNYKKNTKNEIKLSEIHEYHNTHNEDRKEFYQDWRKE